MTPRMGPRGEGWVLLQFLLVVAVAVVAGLAPPWPAAFRPFLGSLGGVLIAAGAYLFVRAVRDLGASLTAFPKPLDSASLRTAGIYDRVRHPIYGGFVLMAAGWSLVRAPLALVPALLLALVLDRKSRREEAFLVERYADYPAYRERVRHRFLPGLR